MLGPEDVEPGDVGGVDEHEQLHCSSRVGCPVEPPYAEGSEPPKIDLASRAVSLFTCSLTKVFMLKTSFLNQY